MANVRIKFSADIVIEANTIKDARKKWEAMPLWSDEAKASGVEYSATLLIEDAETYDDLTDKWEGDEDE